MPVERNYISAVTQTILETLNSECKVPHEIKNRMSINATSYFQWFISDIHITNARLILSYKITFWNFKT